MPRPPGSLALSIRLAFGVCLLTPIGAGSLHAQDSFALYDGDARIALTPARAAQLRRRTIALFEQCHTMQAVVGSETSQADLRASWSSTTASAHVVIEAAAADDSSFSHLAGRGYTLLVGVDRDAGATPVVTRHDGLLTTYIKCPGLEAMALGCALAREVTPGEAWPVCAAVERVRRRPDSVHVDRSPPHQAENTNSMF